MTPSLFVPCILNIYIHAYKHKSVWPTIFVYFQYYSKYAKRPYATSIAEELFQANIIPSDTDFRIFRDYGHVPGKLLRFL